MAKHGTSFSSNNAEAEEKIQVYVKEDTASNNEMASADIEALTKHIAEDSNEFKP